MADMKVSVVVGLVDRLTAPMRGLVGQFQAMGSRMAAVGRQIGVIGGLIGAISFMGPMKQAAAYDAQIRDIAITSGRSGKEAESFIKTTMRAYEGLALKVGQTSENLAKGAQVMIARGMAEPLVQQLMPTLGRVATASGAAVEDVAKTIFALSNTAKIAPEQMELALGRLVTAGKLGAFEFRNMAGEFPELTAQMAKLGVTGMESVAFLGAALQTAMLGTDSPDNLKNFLTKIAAPEAIKNFQKELGVDVVKLMASATAKGINPVEAVIQTMSEKLKVPQKEIDKIIKETNQKGLKGADAGKEIKDRIGALLSGTKVGKLFADMQVLDFLIPTLLNTDKFKAFKEAIMKAGVEDIEKDFATRMAGLDKQMQDFGEAMTHVSRRIGDAFAKNLPAAKQALENFQAWVKKTDEAFPGLLDKVLTISGAVLALGAALAILTPVFAALWGVVSLVGSALALVITAIAATAAAIVTPMGAIVTAIVAAVAAISYALYLLYQNWETVWAAIKSAASTALQAVTAAVLTTVVAIADALRAVEMAVKDAATWWVNLQAAIIQALTQGAQQIAAKGAELIQSLWTGMQDKFAEFIAWVQTIPSRVVSAIGNIDLSGIIKWPSMPSWLGGGSPKPAESGGSPMTDPMGNPTGFNPTSLPSRTLPPSGGVQKAEVGGRIVVTATEGARIVNVESTNAAVPIEPNRGAMLGRA
jgi:TP901 family phage tail tape measure protein